MEGTARSIRLNPQDTRSIGQRFRDNHNNLRGNFSERAREANKKMFEHNPKLSRWGNAMEFINGVAAGALNPFQSGAEALGIDGILDGAGYATDKAAMYAVAPLSAEGKLAAIGAAGSVAGFKQDIGEAVNQWIRDNPNAAETFEAFGNTLPYLKAKNLTKAAKAGKADVSMDFADASKYKQQALPPPSKTTKPFTESLKIGTIYVDSKGNAIPTPPGGSITGSPDGRFIQVRDSAGNPTGARIDGGHNPKGHPDPRAQTGHAHVPGVTNNDGTPWLPIKK